MYIHFCHYKYGAPWTDCKYKIIRNGGKQWCKVQIMSTAKELSKIYPCIICCRNCNNMHINNYTDSYSCCHFLYFSPSSRAEGFVCAIADSTSNVVTGSSFTCNSDSAIQC